LRRSIDGFFALSAKAENIAGYGPEFRMSYWDHIGRYAPGLGLDDLIRLRGEATKTLAPIRSRMSNGKVRPLGQKHQTLRIIDREIKRRKNNPLPKVMTYEDAHSTAARMAGEYTRNLFYDALGFRLRNGETLLNAPQSVINKSQNTIKSYRAERFAKLVDSGNKFAFEEATTYERALRNFQPDAFTPETLPNGEAYTNPDGFRILNKTGSKLFRTYDDTGKLIGVAESKEKAAKKAMDEASKRMEKEEPSTKRFQPSSIVKKAERVVDENGLVDLSGNPLKVNTDGTVTLYHRTTKEKADSLRLSGKFKSLENTDETFFMTSFKENHHGYGNQHKPRL
jgi:hypothetical protein